MNPTTRSRAKKRQIQQKRFSHLAGLAAVDVELLEMLDKAGSAGIVAAAVPLFKLNAAIVAGHASRSRRRGSQTIVRAYITPAGKRALRLAQAAKG